VVFLFFSFFFHCFEPVGPEVRDSELGNGSKVILSGPVDLKHMRVRGNAFNPLFHPLQQAIVLHFDDCNHNTRAGESKKVQKQ